MNNNNNIQKARNYIDCFNQQNPNIGSCCCVGNVGPTGPTGPTGPSTTTVTVGTTTTGLPGTSASVINSGTPNDVVLEFTIPAGATARLVKSSKLIILNYIIYKNNLIQFY